MTQERLYKYLRGETTGAEREQIISWLNASPENMQTFRTLRSVYDAILCGKEDLKLDPKVTRRPSRFARRLRYAAAAAVMALFAGLSAQMYLNRPEPVVVSRGSVDVIATGPGQRSELTLADGTHVWLGPNSKLHLSPDGDSRRVALRGEAFFNVSKDSLNPFIVDAGGRSVTVYGTEFNVSSYPGSDEMSVQLYRGSVAVTDSARARTVALVPGQQVCFTPKDFCVNEFDTIEGSPLWIRGIHAFQNSTYTEILSTMSLVFDVRLTVRGKWAHSQRCTGKFHEADGVESMLGTLQTIRDFKYEWDPDTRQLIIH